MRRDVILFDLDGTLVDSARGIAIALNRLRAERGADALPVEAVRPLVALGAETLVATILGEVASAPGADVAAFRAHLRQVPNSPEMIYPGVPAALAALADAGWRMGVVTNKPRDLALSLLADLDLARWMEIVIGGDSAPRPKPAPDPVLLALARLGATVRQALFVGDSGIDAGAARATALPFLLFGGGYGAADCASVDVRGIFDRFEDLPDLAIAIEGPPEA